MYYIDINLTRIGKKRVASQPAVRYCSKPGRQIIFLPLAQLIKTINTCQIFLHTNEIIQHVRAISILGYIWDRQQKRSLKQVRLLSQIPWYVVYLNSKFREDPRK